MKMINCVICNKEMRVSENTRAGVCSSCIQSGRFSKWYRERYAKGEYLLSKMAEMQIDDPEKASTTYKEPEAEKIKTKKKVILQQGKSRSKRIKELLLQGYTDVEVLATVKQEYSSVDERRLKDHISAEKSELKKKGLLNVNVALSQKEIKNEGRAESAT